MRSLILFLALTFSTLLNAGTIDPNIPDSKYLEYGKDHECVIRIEGTQNDGKRFLASAVLITPKIVITAAHVIENLKDAFVYLDPENKIQVLLFVYPEQYKLEAFGGDGNDIAIGLLSSEIKIEFYPELYSETDELNKICSLAGYGMTGNFNTGVKVSDGKKRAGSNIIEKIESDLLICSLQNIPNTKLEFLIAGGDSGGGLFIDKKLAGIHSSIFTYGNTPPKSDRKTLSVHTRISTHKTWIEKIIEEYNNANIGGTTGVDGK